MDNIIKFGDTTPAPEPTFDYQFTLKDGTKIVENGLLSFNPVFAATVDEEGKLLFAVPMDSLMSIKRVEPRPAFNA